MGTLELLNQSFRYETTYPVINATNRGISYRFMAAEAAYILSGRNDIDYLSSILPHFTVYSDDGEYQAGAYGPPYVDQLPYIINTLNDDPDSRQAVLTIWRPRPYRSKDIPCTLSLQFLIRDGLLHTIANMRSSDAYMGIIYDTFCFSMMSSVVAFHLDVDLGTTWINAGSSHLYQRDWNRTTKLIQNPGTIQGCNAWKPNDARSLVRILEAISKSDKPLQELLNAPY